MEAWREELYHHGVQGMHWGVRRYQNYDGSLTAAGRKKLAKYDTKIESSKKRNAELKSKAESARKEVIKKSAKAADHSSRLVFTTDVHIAVYKKKAAKAIKKLDKIEREIGKNNKTIEKYSKKGEAIYNKQINKLSKQIDKYDRQNNFDKWKKNASKNSKKYEKDYVNGKLSGKEYADKVFESKNVTKYEDRNREASNLRDQRLKLIEERRKYRTKHNK